MNINSFIPVIDENSKVLILGSIPSVKSLEKTQYYGNSRNHFWKLIYSIFEKEIDSSYSDRLAFLLKNHIALWDVVRDCYREGSLDSSIKNPEINDFESLFKKYPNIKFIFFNGSKAEKLFMKNINKDLVEDKSLFKLPSSSPAWTIPINDKLEQWMKIRDCLEQ
ncbi:DNA-deoxyinosine glycosylase [Wukongibacter sp. M2B1]|uniref:DNA-deoxyinosine glycosylase n=1 Tax=Wukongibacter sp. M2B1 TaxID=3088895 RepID=UPI003D7B792A